MSSRHWVQFSQVASLVAVSRVAGGGYVGDDGLCG